MKDSVMLDLQTIDDPRHRNETKESQSAADFRDSYAAQLVQSLRSAPIAVLEAVAAMLVQVAEDGRRIYVVGNGGSAAMADHICCDLVKGTAAPGHPQVDATSLNANMALYTATANDFGFESVFARQIEFFGRPGDILLAISSSGNSENILQAVAAARRLGLKVIAFCGFDGGRLKDATDIVLHAPIHNYGLVEDVHMAWIHVIVQMIALRRDGKVCW